MARMLAYTQDTCMRWLQKDSEENPCSDHSYNLNKTEIFLKQRMGLNVPNKLFILSYHPCSNNS